MADEIPARSPCPGLNSLANHGFIPHNGRNVNFVNLVVAAFEGLGTSPETSAIVGGLGLASSHNPITASFDLEDLRNHLFLIEHDCSISRNDEAVGNNNKFNPELWDVALKVLNQSNSVSPINLGNAKAARIADQRKLNPKTVYGPRAAAFGGIEMGMILSALSTPTLNPLSGRSMSADDLKDSFGTPDGLLKALTFGLGNVKTEYLRSVFEDERLPTHLGWRPTPETNNVFTTLAVGVIALASDPNLLKDVAGVALGSPMVSLAHRIRQTPVHHRGEKKKKKSLLICSSFFLGRTGRCAPHPKTGHHHSEQHERAARISRT